MVFLKQKDLPLYRYVFAGAPTSISKTGTTVNEVFLNQKALPVYRYVCAQELQLR